MAIDLKEYNTLQIDNRNDWRVWLFQKHNSESDIWLIYYKKHTAKKSIPYNDAVEEAICFGWIDTTVKRIDDERYMQKFLPRKKNSKWSELNKIRALKLIKEEKMTEFGLEKINEAKQNGNWDNAYGSKEKQEIPKDLLSALSKNKIALNNFINFAQGYQNNYIYWINDAKKDETRKRRIAKVLERASENIKPGMM